MTVIKRDAKSSSEDLLVAIEKLIPLLKDQGDDDAAEDLADVSVALTKTTSGTSAHKELIARVIDAFEGDHELIAYTLHKSTNDWSEADQLAQASSRVLNLARRIG